MESLKEIQLVFNPFERDLSGLRMRDFNRHWLVKNNQKLLVGVVFLYIFLLSYLAINLWDIPLWIHVVFGILIIPLGLTLVKRAVVLKDFMDGINKLKERQREGEMELAEFDKDPDAPIIIRKRKMRSQTKPPKKRGVRKQHQFEEEMMNRAERRKERAIEKAKRKQSAEELNAFMSDIFGKKKNN